MAHQAPQSCHTLKQTCVHIIALESVCAQAISLTGQSTGHTEDTLAEAPRKRLPSLCAYAQNKCRTMARLSILRRTRSLWLLLSAQKNDDAKGHATRPESKAPWRPH